MPKINIPDAPRLIVELTHRQHEALNRLIPWGVKSQLFRVLVDDLIVALKTDPDAVLGALLTRSMKLPLTQERRHG